jgi:hypothetical protein
LKEKSDLISLEFGLCLPGFRNRFFCFSRRKCRKEDDYGATFQLDVKRPKAETADRKTQNIDYEFPQNDGGNNVSDQIRTVPHFNLPLLQ